MKKNLSIPALGIAAAIALAGCGTGGDAGTGNPAPSSSTQESAPATNTGTAEAAVEHNAADTMFAQMMIPHHAQAIEMSNVIVEKDNIDQRVADLAEHIKAAQGPELEKLDSMLQAWGEPDPMQGEGHPMGGSMDGMMSEGQMGELSTAAGTDAARLFLTQMMEHHTGAVEMAEEEVSQGENEQAIVLARDMIVAQESEIDEMTSILRTL